MTVKLPSVSLLTTGNETQFEGVCEGRISGEPVGTNGFGYDPVFVPKGSSRTFAQMNTEEKNIFSHRKKAMDKLIAFLQEQHL